MDELRVRKGEHTKTLMDSSGLRFTLKLRAVNHEHMASMPPLDQMLQCCLKSNMATTTALLSAFRLDRLDR